MYLTDNKDKMVFPNWGDSFDGWLYPAGNPLTPSLPPGSGTPVADWIGGQWFQYMKQTKSYFCPKDVMDPNFAQRACQLSSYTMNGSPCGFPEPVANQTCKATQVWSPSCYLFWEPDVTLPSGSGEFEHNDGANYPGKTSGGSQEGVGLLHNKTGGNISRMDGGTVFMTYKSFVKDGSVPGGGPGGKNLFWWSPYYGDGGLSEF
jgi:hypothetical protein